MFLLSALGCRLIAEPSVTLINASPWPIEHGMLLVGPDKLWSGDLAPGERVELRFAPERDAGFIVTGIVNGKPLNGTEQGYTTPGDHGGHVLRLDPDGSIHDVPVP